LCPETGNLGYEEGCKSVVLGIWGKKIARISKGFAGVFVHICHICYICPEYFDSISSFYKAEAIDKDASSEGGKDGEA
jgi:hypothetical protein